MDLIGVAQPAHTIQYHDCQRLSCAAKISVVFPCRPSFRKILPYSFPSHPSLLSYLLPLKIDFRVYVGDWLDRNNFVIYNKDLP
jgi:hypothetical protein